MPTLAKKPLASPEAVDPDDAPELMLAMLDQAEVFEGDRFIRRGHGRPKSDAPKETIAIRLDQDVPARLRASGRGWQSRINQMLRRDLALNPAEEKDKPALAFDLLNVQRVAGCLITGWLRAAPPRCGCALDAANESEEQHPAALLRFRHSSAARTPSVLIDHHRVASRNCGKPTACASPILDSGWFCMMLDPAYAGSCAETPKSGAGQADAQPLVLGDDRDGYRRGACRRHSLAGDDAARCQRPVAA